MHEADPVRLGDPDLQVAGLRVWVHGREFPEASDFWDGNWLRVTVAVQAPDSDVRASGPILRLPEIALLLAGCEELNATLKGRAALECVEPNLRVELNAGRLGHIDVVIEITPDHLGESHRYTDTIDQTFLPPIIASCRTILEAYPIRDPGASVSNEPAESRD